MNIKHFHNKDIDTKKWDQCIHNALNPSVYPLSWYLDITSPDWEGIFTADYDTVLPLPVKTKFGRKVIHQPEFSWQLGLFSTESLSPDKVMSMLDHVPSNYRFGNYHMNKFNTPEPGKFTVQSLQTTELELISNYDKIRAGYDPGTNKRVNLARKKKISVVRSISNHDFLQFAYKFDRFNSRRLNPTRLIILRQIVSNTMRYRMGEIFGAYTRENNLCAAIFIIHYKGRSAIQYAASDTDGLNSGALFMMIDHIIITHAEKSMILTVDSPFNRNLSELLRYFGARTYTFAIIRKKRFLF